MGRVRLAILGVAAICQRAYLTLWRQPVLIISTMLFPLIYLVVLGNALNRQLRHIPLVVVDEANNALSASCRRGFALPRRQGLPQRQRGFASFDHSAASLLTAQPP